MSADGLTVVRAPEGLRAAAQAVENGHSVAGVAAMSRDDTGDVLREVCPDAVGALASVSKALSDDGLALLQGVPTDSDVLLALMCQFVGGLVAATERPVRYIDHVTPSDATDPRQRPHSQRRTALMPHTDQSARGEPPHYLVLACVANDAETGGESVLVRIEPIAQWLAASDPRSYDLLQEPEFPIFNVPKRDFAITAPLLTVEERDGTRRHALRFRDEAVRAGMREMNRPSDAHVAAFERLSSEIHDERWWSVHRLVPGEVLFLDNRRVLHGRKAILGERHRDLKRLNGRYWPGVGF
ncbi:hypothetical protein DP939_06130 [Spongiactinospora rosea]|uniref:TauD/TfdA-like domain-containing protein n=1 Tax=Spongiactinospora rosea TaxID=2248750 RepID=A0A366M388_9ACTN|nr:TauD/TfdA family dioxygenase [Spongiactinospora rosea]RBQ20661.1 hypothetical protein DP939_06130 [Spongiactinospora rosea]